MDMLKKYPLHFTQMELGLRYNLDTNKSLCYNYNIVIYYFKKYKDNSLIKTSKVIK